jgi:excisionase family DNA binding protein
MEKIVAVRETSPPDFLTVEEAAKVLRLGRTAMYRLVRAGVIPSERFGKQFRIPRVALEQMLGGPITWPPVDVKPPVQRVAPVTSSVARPRKTKRRSSGDSQSSFPFSA